MALTLLRSLRMTLAPTTKRATLLVPVLAMFALAAHFAGCGSTDDGANGGTDGGADGTVDGTAGDGGNHGDGGLQGDGSCAGQCPANYQCGPYVDCTGAVIACGKPCANGVTCDDKTHQCIPDVCHAKNLQCGAGKDACGVPYNCGGCDPGKECVSGQCVPYVPTDAGGSCSPGMLSCTGPDGQPLCGTISDGCGHKINCTCTAPATCGGGGIAGQCGEPVECQGDAGVCGSFPNSCGSGTVSCAPCPTGQQCQMNKCVTPAPCVPNNPNPCAGKVCGSASDGCKMVQCGPSDYCSAGDAGVCDKGQCCQPLTCADYPDAGCGPLPNNCGGNVTCQTCGNDERCVSGLCTPCPTCNDGGVCDYTGQCCYPKTCADFPSAGCLPVNPGCGAPSIVCHPCATGQVCLSASNSCCTPQACNGRTGLVDDGCGGTLYCGPPR